MVGLVTKIRPHTIELPFDNEVSHMLLIIDSCHEKIDLFRVHNWVIHELAWWKGSQVYQPVKLFSEWLANFLLIWQQIYHSGSNRTDFMTVFRPKNCQNFEPWRGLFSRDMRHMFWLLRPIYLPPLDLQVLVDFKGTSASPEALQSHLNDLYHTSVL